MQTKQILKAVEMMEGDGARVRRLFPTHLLQHCDPFVLLDEFVLTPPAGFPTHPHRGFEAITYMLEGGMHHADNLGNDTIVMAGGVQRFTAGRGILHSEMPGREGRNHGIQLWLNLPRAQKEMPPAYQQVEPAAIPRLAISGGEVRRVVGEDSPVKVQATIYFEDYSLQAGAQVPLPARPGFQGFLFMLEGDVACNGEKLSAGEALLLADPASITVRAESASRLLVLAGQPLNEPIRVLGTNVL